MTAMRHAIYSRTQVLRLLWAISLPVTVGVALALVAETGTAGWPGVALLLLVTVGTLRLGSDEPERLAGFITARLPAALPDRTRPR